MNFKESKGFLLFINVHPGTVIFVAIIWYVLGTSNIGSSKFGPKRGPFIQKVKSFGHMVKILWSKSRVHTYTDLDSKNSATFLLWYIQFFSDWFGQKLCVQYMLLGPNGPSIGLNQFNKGSTRPQEITVLICKP